VSEILDVFLNIILDLCLGYQRWSNHHRDTTSKENADLISRAGIYACKSQAVSFRRNQRPIPDHCFHSPAKLHRHLRALVAYQSTGCQKTAKEVSCEGLFTCKAIMMGWVGSIWSTVYYQCPPKQLRWKSLWVIRPTSSLNPRLWNSSISDWWLELIDLV
jgi:hypothetical protein